MFVCLFVCFSLLSTLQDSPVNLLGLLRDPFEDRSFKPTRSCMALVGMFDNVTDPEVGPAGVGLRDCQGCCGLRVHLDNNVPILCSSFKECPLC